MRSGCLLRPRREVLQRGLVDSASWTQGKKGPGEERAAVFWVGFRVVGLAVHDEWGFRWLRVRLAVFADDDP